jgi:hypothetical protein
VVALWLRRNVNKEVNETLNQFRNAVLFTQSVVVPWSWSTVNTWTGLMYPPQPSVRDCSHCTSRDSGTGCDRWLHPRGSHTCYSAGVSGTSTDFSYFKANRMDMAVRIERERNRNQLTTGHSCAGVDRGLSACPLILTYKYCMVYSYSHIKFRCMMASNKWLLTVNLIFSGTPMKFQMHARVKWLVVDVKTEKSARKTRGFGSVRFFDKTAVFGSIRFG